MRLLLISSLLVLSAAPLACKSSSSAEKQQEAPVEAASAAPSAPAPATPPTPAYARYTKGNPATLGPELVILAGRGVSATRFGATFETIERHMASPCDVRTETRCLYVDRAIDFTMKDGVVSGIKIQRRDRRVPGLTEERYFGSFHGYLPPSIMPGLHRHVVEEEFGAPDRKEPVTDGAEGLIERHFYDGLALEYDKLENGNVVLSSIEIIPSKTAKDRSLGAAAPAGERSLGVAR